MSTKRIVEVADQKLFRLYRGKDQIPGTTKVQTYCGNSSLYSERSTIDWIGSNQYHPTSKKR